MTAEQSALVEEHIWLPYAIVRGWKGRLMPHIDVCDLEGEALLALCVAATRYVPGGPVVFREYARHRIQGAVLDALRRHCMVNGVARGSSSPLFFDLTRLEIHPTADPALDVEHLLAREVMRRVRQLPPRQARVLIRWLASEPWANTVREFKVSEVYLHELKNKALNSLRKSFK